MANMELDTIQCNNPTCDNDVFEEVRIVSIKKDFNKVKHLVGDLPIPARFLEESKIAYRCTICGAFLY